MAEQPESRINRVVLVGHCGADTGMLRHAIASVDPDIEVATEHDQEAVEKWAEQGSLLLINRVLEGRFFSSSGVDLIRQLKDKAENSRMLLVSNYADAQQEAEAAGAIRGFGKSDVRSDVFRSRILAGLGRTTPKA